MPSPLEVPWQQLSPDALQGLLESYINREGTDYGEVELSLDAKLARLRAQVEKGEVLIFFDEETETCQLIGREEARGLSRS